MGKYASGKYALAISDRSGMAFPYDEMVREWNGSLVHYSEYEPKQPQLEPKPVGNDPQALQNPRVEEEATSQLILLNNNPFEVVNYSGTTYVNVYSQRDVRAGLPIYRVSTFIEQYLITNLFLVISLLIHTFHQILRLGHIYK